MDDVAMRVGEDLDLDVARIDHGLLQDQLARAEGALGLGPRRADRFEEIGVALDAAACRARPPPAAAFTITGRPILRASFPRLESL